MGSEFAEVQGSKSYSSYGLTANAVHVSARVFGIRRGRGRLNGSDGDGILSRGGIVYRENRKTGHTRKHRYYHTDRHGDRNYFFREGR